MSDFQSVGTQFIAHYYNTLTTGRANLGALYTDQSMLSYEGEQFMGTQQIMEKLNGLPNLTFDSASAVADYQPSQNDGIFVLVSGCLCIDGNTDAPLRFTQTFLLARGGAQGYYIHNEVMRLNLGWTVDNPFTKSFCKYKIL